jgi:PAS domain S-box-containing protein
MVTGNDSLVQSFKTEEAREHKFQSLINSVNGFEEFILDKAGIIISSNLEAVTITGYEEWEVIGKHISLFYTSEEIRESKPEEDLRKTLTRGKHITTGFKVKKKGSLFFAKMKFVHFPGEKHPIYRVVLFDSTHRAMSAVSSKRIKEEYFSLFNNSFIGIFKFRMKDFAFTLLNEKSLQIIQRERGHLCMSDIFYDASDFQLFHEKLINTKSVNNFEFRLNVPGSERFCSISCKLFAYRHTTEGIISDVTEKRNQLNQIQKLNAELDKFLYHASHDMRAPLSSILGLTSLIRADQDRNNLLEYAERISDRARFMDTLLKDLSHVAYNNSQPVQEESVDLSRMVEEILSPLSKEYPFVRSRTEIHIRKKFYSDSYRLSIILANIISNAFRYHRHDIAQHHVHIKVQCIEECAVIEVEDNGCGIAPEYAQDIFNVFFTVNSRGKGSGLGLYVAQIMLQKLGGRIEVISKPNRGTCFTLTIPNHARSIS